MAKKKQPAKSIQNRRARHDYELDDSFLVGIELTGAEVKSLRMGHGQLRGSYVTIKNNELYLINASVTGSSGINIDETLKNRDRKLLAKRREIDNLISAKQQGRTIIPLELLNGGRYIKVRIAIGRGKKKYDKRQRLKERDDLRQTKRELKLN